MLLPAQPLNVLTHDDGLFLVAVGRLQHHTLTLVVAAEHILGNLSFVLAYQTVGRLHDELRRAIVLFQFKQACVIV